MASGQLVFQPPKFDWHMQRTGNRHLMSGRDQITLALHASSINRDIWFATIIGYLGKEGFKYWNTLPISPDEEAPKGSRESL